VIAQSELRLSAQRAFLGRIHPEMRLVKIKALGQDIRLCVVMSVAPTAKITEDISNAAAEIVSDFPTAVNIEECIETSTAPLCRENILAEGWVYQRAE
jgi:hypothetical protein